MPLSIVAFSRRVPVESLTTRPPQSTAMSSSIAVRLSPYDGALIAAQLNPRSLLTMIVDKMSSCRSSAMMRSGAPDDVTLCKQEMSSWMLVSFLSAMRMNGFSSSTSPVSAFVTMYGLMQLWSTTIPSTILLWMSIVLPFSTLIVPSLPILSMTSAIVSPISLSWFADTVATRRMSSFEETGLAFASTNLTARFAASIMPFFTCVELLPSDTYFKPFLYIDAARTVEVVVPSPQRSFDFSATSLIAFAPRFSNLSFSSIALATVTPSREEWMDPNSSIITFRPPGPSVVLTAFSSFSTPAKIFCLASWS